jgi:hypothetical protein
MSRSDALRSIALQRRLKPMAARFEQSTSVRNILV